MRWIRIKLYLFSQIITCRQGRRRRASSLLTVSPPCFGHSGGAVVSATLLHTPPALWFAVPVDENLSAAELLQELLLHILCPDPGLFLLPTRTQMRDVRGTRVNTEIIYFLQEIILYYII